MARVTIEDCTKIIHSRFELVVIAAQRVRDIASGARVTVDKHNDKTPVIALREISLSNININTLRDTVIKKYQKFPKTQLVDGPEDKDLSEDQNEIAMEIRNLASTEDLNSDDFFEEDSRIEE